jgi:hypothetical protein
VGYSLFFCSLLIFRISLRHSAAHSSTAASFQELFEILAEYEAKLFYAYCADPQNDVLKAAHAAARKALEEFAKVTGCHN